MCADVKNGPLFLLAHLESLKEETAFVGVMCRLFWELESEQKIQKWQKGL